MASTLSCTCGQVWSLEPDFRGGAVCCPSCGVEYTVPGLVTEEAPARRTGPVRKVALVVCGVVLPLGAAAAIYYFVVVAKPTVKVMEWYTTDSFTHDSGALGGTVHISYSTPGNAKGKTMANPERIGSGRLRVVTIEGSGSSTLLVVRAEGPLRGRDPHVLMAELGEPNALPNFALVWPDGSRKHPLALGIVQLMELRDGRIRGTLLLVFHVGLRMADDGGAKLEFNGEAPVALAPGTRRQ